jgi:hypothetical protein
MLWLRRIDVKSKQSNKALTRDEEVKKAVADVEFNVPQPLYAYLSQIGTYPDAMGKEMELDVPTLPTSTAQGHGGYHAPEVTENNHILFEEVPSLGIAGDMVMALTQERHEPEPDFHITFPEGSRPSKNLCGAFGPIGYRRPEIKQKLNGQGITPTEFPEYVEGTGFNRKYLLSISDILGKFETFRIEKVTFAGGETQTIITRPTEEDGNVQWTKKLVQASSSSTSSTGQIGASYLFAFQLYKEAGEGRTETARALNWCYIELNNSAIAGRSQARLRKEGEE